ncbi:MAG: hypothetical protein M1840_007593 [Geoglossum simile]|nr:MAG: hypothetical protein M1840_007593 [Geoglossum simile]
MSLSIDTIAVISIVRLEDELREEHLNHEASKSALHSERYYHEESKKHNECLWIITKRIQDLYSKEDRQVVDEECNTRKMQFEIADLMIDNEEKRRLIQSLQTELKDRSQGGICYEKELEHRRTMFEAALAETGKRISELEGSLQEAQASQALLMRRKSTVRKYLRIDTMVRRTVAPSFRGGVKDGNAAKMFLNASLRGQIYHVPQQPCNTDIQKGYGFISEKNASGVEKWDDGFVWGEVVRQSEDESCKDFKIHVTADGVLRKMWTFEVNGVKHLVVSYY